jgi:hypothetical protein
MSDGHQHGHGQHDQHGAAAGKEHGFSSELANEWGSALLVPANGVVVAGNPPVVQTTGTPSKTSTGQPYRLINRKGDLKGTQMVSVMAFTRPPPPDPATGLVIPPGPIIGILDFSGGGGGGTVEFDVPCNAAGGVSAGTLLPGVAPGGGAIVSVPAGFVQFSVRNDANLSPNAGATGAAPIGQAATVSTVSAFAGYGSKTGRLTRTVWAASFNPTFGIPGGAPSIFVNVPAFARTFRILRLQTVPADTLEVSIVCNQLLPCETFALPGGILSPEFLLGPAAVVQLDFPVGNTGVFEKIAVVFSIENGAIA